MKNLYITSILGVALWAAPAFAQQAELAVDPDIAAIIEREIANGAPTETSGIEETVQLGAVALSPYYQAMNGARLRARIVVMEPGGKILVHAHDKRPTFTYVLEGELVEHRSDMEAPVIRRAGDSFFESDGLVHWSENVSSKPVRALAVDILPPDGE